MIALFHFFRLAVRNLLRGGQRVLVALLCITFGIMSLVAMTMLAKSIESAVVLTPSQLLGGDISMGRAAEDTIRPEDIDQLQSLQESDLIDRYTLIAFSSSLMFHTPGSGDMHFIGNALGVEPDKYPLAGSLTIAEPGSTGLPTLLQQVGDVVVTRDIARQNHLEVGTAIVLADPSVGVPLDGTVRAIAGDTPNHYGDKIYFSLATAQRLANDRPAANTVIVNTADPETLVYKLNETGWSVDWAAGRDDHTANLWTTGLRGAGILGLLVGGIGIANTMQVLLRRRQHEIAVWKTLGYRQGQLRLIFALEAGLLGLAGSLLGAGLGVLVSTGLLDLFQRTSTLLYQWIFSPIPPLMGVLVGTFSTVIFASWAILVTGQARPMALLRNERIEVQGSGGWQSVLLALLLAVPFIALIHLIMGSLIASIGVLAGILIGITGLGAIFSGALWVCTHLLPLGGFPLARMALNSLRRRGVALVFAMIALFVGVLSLSMGLMVAQTTQKRISSGAVDVQGYNLNILAAADQESAIRQAVESQDPEKVSVNYRTTLAGLSTEEEGASIGAMDAVLVGVSDPQDYLLSGAGWGSQPDGVYASKWANLKAGSRVQAAFLDGAIRTFIVVGSYEYNYNSMNLLSPTGLLMPADAFKQVARPDSLTFSVQVAPQQLQKAVTDLGSSLPQATVVDLVAYAARFMQSYRNLYVLALAMAGLSMLAGFLLVANSVSLAMLDRRYEIGVLKTVGYSRRKILSIFAVEFGLAGVLATAAGVLIVQAFLAMLAAASHLSVFALMLNLPSLAMVVFCGIGLTLLIVLSVTWNPASVSPGVVLNERSA